MQTYIPSSGTSPNSGTSTTGPDRMALDNLIRRELKVGDPGNSAQVAEALIARYQTDPRTRALDSEAKGMPFLITETPSRIAATAGSFERDLEEAIDDVNKDLVVLTTSNLLKDFRPELEGWSSAIRTSIKEGAGSARFALDPHQRDKTFAMRRQLNQYARMARMAGIATPSCNDDYRSLAQSLDEAANVLLVMMGDALSEGLNDGTYLLQVPVSDLEARRSSVINALRNLAGTVESAYDQETWPRGLHAYGKLLKTLEDEGQSDLRSLLNETELVRIMDDLISRAGNANGDGLRSLGATAQVDLQRFRRLIAFWGRVNKDSPSLATFLRALQIFAEGFDRGGGTRLTLISRPPLLLYGLSSQSFNRPPQMRLITLAMCRPSFAAAVDCYMSCECSALRTKTQIQLDMLLYDLDRAIDLYAIGSSDNLAAPEFRAHAYHCMFEYAKGKSGDLEKELIDLMDQIAKNLNAPAADDTWPKDELCGQGDAEVFWQQMLQSMAPQCGKVAELDEAVSELLVRSGHMGYRIV